MSTGGTFMNTFLILSIVSLWITMIVVFTKWRVRSVLQNGTMAFNAINDWWTNLFVKASAIMVLLLIFYVI